MLQEKSTALPVSYADILIAQQNIKGVAHRTPVFTSRQADELVRANLFFKCENFQRTGCSGFRGAYNAMKHLGDDQLGVVAFSSGNHGMASALAAKILDVQLIVIVPTDIPPLKLAAIKEYGAQVIFYDRVFEDRYAIVEKFSKEYGWTILPPYDHKDVIAGQGTAIKELVDEVGPLDYIVIPIGGGGLISGSAIVANELLPNCVVIGVEPETANDAQQSLRVGELVAVRSMSSTIADGARARRLGSFVWPIVQKYVHTIETVSDKELCLALQFFVERMKMIVEPTACLAPAAIFAKKIAVEGKRVGIIVSGGNVDANVLSSCLKRI